MYTPSASEIAAATAPENLLLLMADDEPTLFGFECDRDGLGVHVRPLMNDERCGATGTFCERAPSSWDAVGVVASGRTRRLDSAGRAGPVLQESVSTAAVLHRDGRHASRITVDGEEVAPGDLVGATTGPTDPVLERLTAEVIGPLGLMVDGMACVLGIDPPGAEPPATLLGLSLWAHDIVAALARGVAMDRIGLVELFYLYRADSGSPALVSAEALVDELCRDAEGFSWPGFHATSAARAHAFGLDVAEAEWMHPTMYARWVLGSLACPAWALEALQRHDPVAGQLYRDVVDALVARWDAD